jgi:hypothetical protein
MENKTQSLGSEIEKILDRFQFDCRQQVFKEGDLGKHLEPIKTQATSSLTALIIKWLEGKKIDILDHHEKYYKDCHRCIEIFACNQLITELVEEIK